MRVHPTTQKLSQVIKTRGKHMALEKGELIQSTDDSHHLSLVKSGYVKKFQITNDGSIRIQIVYGPGDIFPLSVAFKALLDQDLYEGPEVHYYETMCRTELARLDEEQLKKCVENEKILYRDLFSEAGRRLYANISYLENVGLPNAHKRVAQLIAFYAHEYGTRTLQGIRLKIPVTQQDIADALSLTRETVSSNINQLRTAGLLRRNTRALIIKDLKKLEEAAYS